MLRLSRPALLLLLAGLSASALAKAPETVNIGYQKANIFALLKYRGTLDESFKKQGIAVRWIEFPAGPQMLEGLNVGSIDLAATGDAPPAFAQVGLNKGSDVNYLLVTALEKAGLSYKDITPVYLPPADARAAFQRGAIDAWVIWDPFLAEVETNAKARQIGNAEGLVPHYTFYLASRKFADTYPDTAKQVVDELSKLSEWANSHQEDAAGILSTSTGLDKAIWLKTLARLPYGAERMTPAVYNEQQALADTFTRIGLLPVKVDVRSATWSLDKQ